ncbi:MAG: hypothetical protein ACXWAX_11140 [Chthoniobacterales bacterium]
MMQTPNRCVLLRPNNMKTYVFVFVPVQDVPHFRKRLRDCLASIPEAFAHRHHEQTTNEAKKEEYPYWTWFLPNPLPPPIERELRK